MNLAEQAKSIQPTEEQSQILDADGDLKINSCAGSGKTTTIKLICEKRQEKTLVLVFNKHNKTELENKMRRHRHVTVMTMNSLANKLFSTGRIELNLDFSLTEIVTTLGLDKILANKKGSEVYMIAALVKKCFEFYCASNVREIELCKFEYSFHALNNEKLKDNLDLIYDSTKRLLSAMRNGRLKPTFSYILKVVQLSGSAPNGYDRIIFDEAQDVTAAMLDVFSKSKGQKIILGDSDQSIYSWRYTVNAFEVLGSYKEYHLSNSFRFGKVIANYANIVLSWKKTISPSSRVRVIHGMKEPYEPRRPVTAYLSKTGHGLLLKALESLYDSEHFYFEGGNLNSYLSTNDGNSIIDVYKVFAGRQHEIRNPLLKSLSSMDEVTEVAKSSKDKGLLLFRRIVEELADDTPKEIERLKNKTLPVEKRDKADTIFSNVHRAKGYEYDRVVLLQDFISKSRVISELDKGQQSGLNLEEEVNLLYVAMTRSKGSLRIPKSVFE